MHSFLKSALGLSALLASPAQAFFRMPCGQNIVTERIDPIIAPGAVSAHVHQVNGGNGFGFTEDYTAARQATCTSCMAKQDSSNYWTPILYYKDQQGQFTKVDQNGMTVYYLQRGTDTNYKAFPEGFRMIAGNPFKRNFTGDFAAQAVSFVCLDYSGSGAGGEWNYLPTHACPDGIRAQVFFPSCWDGVNVDSADHQSHMAYPESGSYNGGTCPSSHPVQLISIFYEVIFDSSKFQFWNGDYGSNQPFVLAMGDPTGYGFHGDFINGWDIPVLQSAIDTCTAESGTMEDCHVLDLNTGDEMAACTIPGSVNEDITGPFDKLPGCNPVSAGPNMAAPVTDCATTAISGPQIPFTDMTSKGWAYQGCAEDDVNSRTLTGTNNIYSEDQATTDVDSCLQTCAGSTYAGLEYGKQCFCGDSIPSGRAPQASTLGSCNMPCAGNSSQICGGGSQISLYKVCAPGSSCTNAAYKAIGNLSGSGSGSGSAAGYGTGNSTSSGSTNSGNGSGSGAYGPGAPSSSAAPTPANNNQANGASHVPVNPPNPVNGGGSGSAPANAATTDAPACGPRTHYVTKTEVSYVTERVTVTATPKGANVKKHGHHKAHAKNAKHN